MEWLSLLWNERGFFGGGPSPPRPQPITPPPTIEDPAVQRAAEEAARRRKTARGYRSTILSEMVQTGGGLQTNFGGGSQQA